MGSGGITRHLVDLAMGFVGAVGRPGLRERAGQHDAGLIIGSATAQVAIMSR
jgi:TRAP-type C4-dicarboxylate transport system permease large subunit